MNNFHQMLLERHSIRRYTAEPIEAEQVKLILEAALLAPTSKSSRAWQFVVVEDKEMLLRMAESKPVATVPIKNCVMAVVVAMDPEKSEAWIEDGSVAASFMQLQAAALGLGSCWVELRGRLTADGYPSTDYVRDLLGMPQGLVPMCVVTFGHPDEVRRPVDPAKLLWEKVHIGTWKNVE